MEFIYRKKGENIVGEEDAGFEAFSLFPYCFRYPPFSGSLRSRIVC